MRGTPQRAPVKRRWWLVGTLLALAVVAGIALAAEAGGWGELMSVAEAINPVLTLVLMALLPLAGFSIGVVYVVAGLKFGLVGGGLAIIAVTAVHLLGTHWIARSFLREPLRRFLERRSYRLPEAPKGAERSLAAMVALVPGAPYFLRNYGLALSGMPLRSYFWVCLGVYAVRSYVTLALGDLGADPSRRGFLWLAGIFVVKVVICAYLIKRIRRKHREMKDVQARAGRKG